jgi:drug/metabolite transporter (DMT)-like permease
MNSTQRTAWIFLFSFLLNAAGFAYVGSIIVFGRMPPRPLGPIVVGAVTLAALALLALAIFFVITRQSRAEPEADERDHMIRGKAITISTVCGCLLLAVILLVLGLTLGQTGSVPVYLLTIILWGVFLAASLIYAVVVLVQYGRTNKEANHE